MSLYARASVHFGITNLIEGESRGQPEYKCVEHHQEHYEAEPGECLKITLQQQVPKVPERIEVNFF